MENIVSFGKLVSDPTRLKIIKLLLTQPMCVCEIMEVLRINQPCVSQHLAILKYHHLLKARRDGKWIVYEINKKIFGAHLKGVRQFLKSSLTEIDILKNEYHRLRNLKSRVVLCKKCK